MKIFSTIIGLSITGMILIGQTSEKKSKGFVMDKVVSHEFFYVFYLLGYPKNHTC